MNILMGICAFVGGVAWLLPPDPNPLVAMVGIIGGLMLLAMELIDRVVG